MKRRHFLNVLAALTLLPLVAVGAHWARSYRVAEGCECTYRRGGLDLLHSEWGAVSYMWHLSPATSLPRQESVGYARYYRYPSSAGDNLTLRSKRFAGFGWLDFTAPTGRLRRLVVPYWALVTVCGAAPAAVALTRLRRRRRTSGVCPACGYDLRATPSRCPECGAAFVSE